MSQRALFYILPFFMVSLTACGRHEIGKADFDMGHLTSGGTASVDGREPEANKPSAPTATPILKAFNVDPKNLVTRGKAAYFILEPGFQLQYSEANGSTLTVTVLDTTKVVDGIETRIVEEREIENGKLSSVSRNYYVIDKSDNNVYSFGEEVDDYENGKLDNHNGTWLSGSGNAHYGLIFPGTPLAGQRFYQSLAPNVSMDRTEILSLGAKVTVPAGTFENCVQIEEASDLDSKKEINFYAPNVGLIVNGEYKLTKFGMLEKE